MNYDYLKKYLPKDKMDDESIIRLCELTDEEFLAISDELLTWIQDFNWPIASPMSVFLIGKQDLIIDKIQRLIDIEQKDDTWKAWIIWKMIPYFSMANQDKLIHLVERIWISPTAGEKSEEAYEAAANAIIEYRKRKERCRSRFNYYRSLYTVADADVRYEMRKLLWDFPRYAGGVSLTVFMIEKQDVIVDDVREVYYSDEIDQDYKECLYDNLIRMFTKENQEKILGKL